MLFEDIERVFNEGINANRHMCIPKALTMRTDVRNCGDKYEIVCDVPGLTKENVRVNMEADVLTIAISMEPLETEKDVAYLVRERSTGKMSRSWRLPDVDSSKISAALENGVLTLTLPKLAEKTKRVIDIM